MRIVLGNLIGSLTALVVATPLPPAIAADVADERRAGKPYVERLPEGKAEIEMVPIPAGTFTLGTPAGEVGRKPDEGPQFKVRVDAFWMK